MTRTSRSGCRTTEITELVALRTDAPVEPAPDNGRKVWLHHGSSISHGSNAAAPTATWPALAAALGRVELVNLGFGGSALLDPFTARAMRDTPADLISLKIGINLVNTDADAPARLRPGRPRLPRHHPRGTPDHAAAGRVPHLCARSTRTPPAPSRPDFSAMARDAAVQGHRRSRRDAPPGRLTLNVIRDELARIVEQRPADDPNLHYLDGRRPLRRDGLRRTAAARRAPPGPRQPTAASARHFAHLAFGDGGPFTMEHH